MAEFAFAPERVTEMAKELFREERSLKRLDGWFLIKESYMAHEDKYASLPPMERAAKLEKPCIFAIGNAPTALISLHEQITAGTLNPALIIGVPVGFVNVVESKEMIIESGVPHIVSRGRKGGSNVAAAICNAMLYQILR